MTTSKAGSLQCGHGDVAVEDRKYRSMFRPFSIASNVATAMSPWKTSVRLSSGGCRRGFNVATAMSPWKTGW